MAAAHAAAAESPTHRASSQATSTPPYPSAARIADSSCFPQYTASLKCLESNQNKSKCQQQFDDYKECKKKEIELESSWKDRCVLEEDEQVLRQLTEAYARALEMGLDALGWKLVRLREEIKGAEKKDIREARLERNRSRTLFG